MPAREEGIAVWLAVYQLFKRNRANRLIRQRLLLAYFGLMNFLEQQNNRRGLYCQIPGYDHRFIAKIFRREYDATKLNLRVNPDSLQRLITLCGDDRKRSGWTLDFEVVIFLFWLACGTAYRIVGTAFDIPRSTIHRIVHKILNKVITILPQIVRLPGEDNLPRIGMAFARKANSAVFRQCVGAIDGCHIRIVCPVRLHDQYYNRKQFYSINLQALVDSDGLFINIMSGYPGSVHDSRMFRNSALFQRQLYPPQEYYIIGDSGYPCRRHPITIITPFRAPLTVDQRAFNRAISKARVTVEQSFGVMEVRWRSIFTKALEVSIPTAIKVIAACCVMHNICVTQGDVIRVNQDLPPLPPRRAPRDEQEGNDLRNLFLRLYTAEQQGL